MWVLRSIVVMGLLAGSIPVCAETLTTLYWTEAANGGKIRAANPDGGNLRDVVTNAGYVRGLAIDSIAGQVYWTADVSGSNHDTIWRANLDGTGRQLLTNAAVNPSSIALDILAGKMYWTDYDADRIQCADLDGSDRRTLLNLPAGAAPLSIALDPSGGKMYWTQFNRQGTPLIQRANLDGSGIELLVTAASQYPTTLVLDLPNGRMFWSDTRGKILKANLNGNDVQIVVSNATVPHGLALDLAGGRMYWSEYYKATLNSSSLDGSGPEHLFDATYWSYVDEIAVVSTVSVPLPPAAVAGGTFLAALSMWRYAAAKSRNRQTIKQGESDKANATGHPTLF